MNAASQTTSPVFERAALSSRVVLDTNATLDWLVFGEAAMGALGKAIEARDVRWLACPRMREELSRTLAYPSLAKWKPDCEHTLSVFDHWVELVPNPAIIAAPGLNCSDKDDQVFIDLAVAGGACWLVTQDRALLKLRRRAAISGVAILPPAQWRFNEAKLASGSSAQA